MRVGVLALQGGYAAHLSTLSALGHAGVEVRAEADFEQIDGLILPGGESTTQTQLINRWNLSGALNQLIAEQKPVLATCAGLILAAAKVSGPEQESFGWLDIHVTRNGWGRQLDSFEALADDGATPLVFIRAPRITRIGPAVTVLKRYKEEAVMVREGNLWGATFHPELTNNLAIHAAVFGS
jgi:5'-phosphate synthase pdxT subunit